MDNEYSKIFYDYLFFDRIHKFGRKLGGGSLRMITEVKHKTVKK